MQKKSIIKVQGHESDQNMRIGIYGKLLVKPGSGIVRYATELTESLVNNDKTNEYVIYLHRKDVKKLKLKGKYEIREVGLPYILWRTPLFTKILDEDNINVFHSQGYNLPLVPRSVRKVRFVSTFHGLLPFWHSFRENIYSGLNFRFAAMFADRIISVSDTVRHEIHDTYGKPLADIDVTYFGLNENLKPLSKKEINTAKKQLLKYGLKYQGYVAYIGGAMRPNKNLDTILSAWSLLKKRYGWKIPLLITRVDMAALKKKLDALDLKEGIDIIGSKWIEEKDIRYLYAGALIAIYPSVYDGLGFPIIEAMACGAPVITSNIAAMPEAAGGAGLLVDRPKDPEEWVNKIIQLSKDKKLRSKLIQLGLEHAKDFTWKKVAKETVDTYRKAAQK